MTSPMLDAIARCRDAIREYIESPSMGTRYALEMAAEELRLLGLNPERVTTTGYEVP